MIPRLTTPMGQSTIQWKLVGIDLTAADGRKLFSYSDQRNALISLMNSVVSEFEDEFEIYAVRVSFESMYSSSKQHWELRKLEERDEITNGSNRIESSMIPSTIKNLSSLPPTIASFTIMMVIVDGRAPLGVDFEDVTNKNFLNFKDSIVEEMRTIVTDVTEVYMEVLDVDRPSVSPSIIPSSSPTVSNVPTRFESLSMSVLSAVGGAAAAGAAAVSFMHYLSVNENLM